MKSLRAFLFSGSPSSEWACAPHRELEPLLEATQQALAVESASAAIHIGFWRPETAKVAELVQQWSGRLLLSESSICALPPPVVMSQASVGEVDGLAFHVALDGFGYQMDDPSHGEPKKRPPAHASHATGKIAPRGWVEQLILHKPESEALLCKATIWDDGSYHEHESSLETDERIELALDRYRTVTGVKVDQTNILDNLHACPNWLLNDRLSYLDLTVRMSNVFDAHSMTTIGDLASKGYSGLLKLPNMGQGSVHGFGKLLWRLFIHGDTLRRKKCDLPDAPTDGPHNVRIPDDIVIEDPVAVPGPTFAHIVDGVIDAAQVLTEQERGIWAARIGFRCENQTLQQIATAVGLTRERVRQIEVKIYRKVQNHLIWSALENRLTAHFEDRTSPLLLNGISAIDPWFKGVEELKVPMREVFHHLMQDKFTILDINETPVITRLPMANWEDAVSSGKTLLREMVSEKVSEDYACVQIGTLINGPGEELRDELWATVRPFAMWAKKADGERILVGYGRTAEAVIAAILESAGHPLHYEEIHRRSKHVSEKEHEQRALHHAARNVAVLYKRGTYGLLSHCPLTSKDLALIDAEVEDIAAGADPSKQWHTSELLDELLERGFDFDGKLTKYIINIALRESKSFANMRRMVWGYKDSWQASAASRLDMRQAVMALLEEAGRPLNTLEIREKLEGERGLNNHFQIHPQGNLIRLGTGLWGLANRDIKVGDPDALLGQLEQHLQVTQEGVHSSEVAGVLGGIDEDNALALLGLVKQKGMRRDRAQYVYLSSWGESRRIWPARAVDQALDAHPEGMTIEQVRLEVSRTTKRDLNGPYIGQLLYHTEGSSYNSDTELWSREQVPAGETDESEEETATSDYRSEPPFATRGTSASLTGNAHGVLME